MAWDDCYTARDYDRYCGYDLPPDPEPPDWWYEEPEELRKQPLKACVSLIRHIIQSGFKSGA